MPQLGRPRIFVFTCAVILAAGVQPAAAFAGTVPGRGVAQVAAKTQPTRHSMGLVAASEPAGVATADPNNAPQTADLSQEGLQALARRQATQSGGAAAGYDAAVRSSGVSIMRERFTPPSQPEPDLIKECETNPAAGQRRGHIRNRIMWCARYKAFDYDVENNGRQIGFVHMEVTVIGYGRDDGQRNLVLFLKPDSVVFGGSYTPASLFGFDVECTHSTPGCGTVGGRRWLPVSTWALYAATNQWVSWQVTSDESVSTLQDRALYHVFNFELVAKDGATGDANDGNPTQPRRLEYFVRCDTADYFLARPKACIFHDVVPHLQYRIRMPDGKDSDHREVAEHIKQAFDDPNGTRPRFEGRAKNIPGNYRKFPAEDYLERVPYDDTVGSIHYENGLEKDRACHRRAPYRDNGLPEPPRDGQQCDEYPFASTMQGASARRRGLDWDFSVKAVDRTHNNAAGQDLRAFYRDDRILYSVNQPRGEWMDLFYVEILEGGEGGGAPVDNPPIVDAGPDMHGDEGSVVNLHGSARDDRVRRRTRRDHDDHMHRRWHVHRAAERIGRCQCPGQRHRNRHAAQRGSHRRAGWPSAAHDGRGWPQGRCRRADQHRRTTAVATVPGRRRRHPARPVHRSGYQ
jgi:hypothetical protein